VLLPQSHLRSTNQHPAGCPWSLGPVRVSPLHGQTEELSPIFVAVECEVSGKGPLRANGTASRRPGRLFRLRYCSRARESTPRNRPEAWSHGCVRDRRRREVVRAIRRQCRRRPDQRTRGEHCRSRLAHGNTLASGHMSRGCRALCVVTAHFNHRRPSCLTGYGPSWLRYEPRTSMASRAATRKLRPVSLPLSPLAACIASWRPDPTALSVMASAPQRRRPPSCGSQSM
jgi:hypothetical protein